MNENTPNMTPSSGNPEVVIPVLGDPNYDLWALDVGGDGFPRMAHRIVSRRLNGVEYTGPEDEHEIRVTACGRELNKFTHPRGWWLVRAGELPLAKAEANHCGIRTIDIHG